MEHLLHYVWKYRLYEPASLVTTEGRTVAVIDPGIPNSDAGPDFFNAKARIGETTWAGSVEIHDKASDWSLHHHDTDRAYDGVILHVVGINDADIRRTNGEPIPTLVLPVPDAVRVHIDWLSARDNPIPCLSRIREIDPVHIASWMDALLAERLERKTADTLRLLERYEGDWNEAFYVLLTRCFGFGVNNDAFERLARSLPRRCILKQRASESQVEALLFGQAGMLSEEEGDPYYRLLRREYAFLRHKFDLSPLDESVFKSLRLRPDNFPHVRLAQLAALWYRYDTLFARIIDARSPRELKDLFRVPPSAYWDNHYHFRYASPGRAKTIGEGALNILLINAVVPTLFAYGSHEKQPEYQYRATRLLERVPPERNQIVATFARAGIPARDAGDTQALVQLRREYCEKRKCLYCRIGFRLLKRSVNESP